MFPYIEIHILYIILVILTKKSGYREDGRPNVAAFEAEVVTIVITGLYV